MKWINGIKEKMSKFFYEEYDEEEELEEIEEKEVTTSNVDTVETKDPFKDIEVKEQNVQPEIVELAVEKQNEQQSSPFVTLNNNPVKKDITPIITKPAQEKYTYRGVISPIYGNTCADNEFMYNSSSSNYKTKEEGEKSIIGTIFSPINGNETFELIKEDEVNDQIASLKTSDFISKANIDIVSDEQPYIPTNEMAEEKVFVQPTTTISSPPVENITEFIKSEQPVNLPGQNKDVDDVDEYENLTLF